MASNTRTRLALLLLLLLTLPACGVVLSARFEGTEVFRDLDLAGDFKAGSPISVTLTVNQAYPVALAVSCRYENVDITDDERKVAFNERALTVFETVLAPEPGYAPGDKESLPPHVFEFDFSIPRPGDYFIACFTLAAPENGIGRGFTITR